MTTRSQDIAADIAALLRARNSLLWVITREEGRVEKYLFEAAIAAKYIPRTWDCAQGVANMAGTVEANIGSPDCGATLTAIRSRAEAAVDRCLWIMRDLAPWVQGPIGISTVRQLRNLARMLPGMPMNGAQAIVILTPSSEIPAELAGHATVIEWPLPDREEIAMELDAAIKSLPEEKRAGAAPNGTRDAAIDAAVGLSGEEASSCFARSLVQLKGVIDPILVGKEKRRVVAREGLLEWFDPLPGGLDSVGGLENLKSWLQARKSAYSAKARAYGLPAPKGCVVVGVSGCGKSLTSKAIATNWGVPLIRLDMGALKSKFVGDSEKQIRKAFQVIEAIGRCVVWIDEIEKAMQGASSGSADGGVSADALGVFLNWMQERKGESFVIATANDVSGLPPEVLRKGRFDEVWFVDVPTTTEREAVLAAAFRAFNRPVPTMGLHQVISATAGFTGAEIAAMVPDAMFAAFNDGEREVEVEDLIAAAETVVPLTKTAAEKIKELREWARGRARPASSAQAEAARSPDRALEID